MTRKMLKRKLLFEQEIKRGKKMIEINPSKTDTEPKLFYQHKNGELWRKLIVLNGLNL
ncbi:MAG: hypothetical protein R2771_13740 [Saprospiraceae bacterium]